MNIAEQEDKRNKFKANRANGEKLKVDAVSKKAETVRQRFISRLTPPNRDDFDREARYLAAKQKQIRYLGAITKVLVLLVKEHSKALILKKYKEELAKEDPRQPKEHLHTISMTKLYCIAAGGGKYIAKKKDDYSEVNLVPLTSTYNDEVRMLVEAFFTQTFRGTNLTGSSKWQPRDIPRFNSAVVELLKEIENNYPKSFVIISAFLSSKKESALEGEDFFDVEEEVIFEAVDVPEKELLDLRDALLTLDNRPCPGIKFTH